MTLVQLRHLISLAATGSFTHVFVDRSSRSSTAIPPGIRDALETLLTASAPTD
jgi:acyl-CoA thioesterase FadM